MSIFLPLRWMCTREFNFSFKGPIRFKDNCHDDQLNVNYCRNITGITKDIESIETSHCRKTKSCCVNVYHKLADKLPCEIKPHKNFLCFIILIKAEFLFTTGRLLTEQNLWLILQTTDHFGKYGPEQFFLPLRSSNEHFHVRSFILVHLFLQFPPHSCCLAWQSSLLFPFNNSFMFATSFVRKWTWVLAAQLPHPLVLHLGSHRGRLQLLDLPL